MSTNKNKYKRAAVFSGGGTLFAMYCGMFAAMEDYDVRPDLLIATCGGSIAATVINSFETNSERKSFLQSKELFDFISSTRLTRQRKIHRIGAFCVKKMFNSQRAPRIEDLFNRYLVDMPMDISELLPSLSNNMNKTIPTIFIGAKMLYDKSMIHQPRNGAKLYRKVLLTDDETAKSINLDKIKINSEHYLNSAIDHDIELLTNLPMLTALRISIADMFYVQPVYYQNQYYAGSIIDLVPIELADSMCNSLFFEKKGRFSKLNESLVRAVFGYDANSRQREVETHKVDYWIDTSDFTERLKNNDVVKKINFWRFEIELRLPKSYEQFVKNMEVQWQYGYEKVAEHFRKNV